jgi:hypothetical protein
MRDTMRKLDRSKFVPFKDGLFRDYVGGRERAELEIRLPAGLYELTAIWCDRSGKSGDHGPFTLDCNGESTGETIRAPRGEKIERRWTAEVDRGYIRLTFTPAENADWFISAFTVRPFYPKITHIPIWTADRDADLRFTASTACAGDVKSIQLSYAVEGKAPKSVEMKQIEQDRRYSAKIAAAELSDLEHLEYWFDAVTESGLTGRLPAHDDPRRRFSLVLANPGSAPPAIRHKPVETAKPGDAIEVQALVTADLSITSVRLHYRYVNQYYEWLTVEMDKKGETWNARIPAGYVVPQWDIMYYIEAIDEGRRGSFWPPAEPVGSIPYRVILIAR